MDEIIDLNIKLKKIKSYNLLYFSGGEKGEDEYH